MKTPWQYILVYLFIMLYKVVRVRARARGKKSLKQKESLYVPFLSGVSA